MRRTTVVTGSASGIGHAVANLLAARSETVIGIDRAGADINVDLSAAAGRAGAIDQIRRAAPRGVDAVIACAGVALSDGPRVVAVNFFGTVAFLTGLLPLLQGSDSARAVVVCSSAAILPTDARLVELCLAGDAAAAPAAAADNSLAYASSKLALVRWIRRCAPLPEWAGSGVLLNGVAPGTVRTPMTEPLLATAEGREVLARVTPIAVRDYAAADDIAPILAFLASSENRYMVGQVPFVDGGADVRLRGEAAI